VPLDAIAHGFTHYRLELSPQRWHGMTARDTVRDNDDLRWVELEALSTLGIPAPIRKLLETLQPQ